MTAKADRDIDPHSFTSGTQKALFRVARGTCYYPGCRREVIHWVGSEPIVDVQIAHVAAPEPTGPRFDLTLTNRERRDISNLVLLCQAHHTEIDKVNPQSYPVELLHEWKIANEGGPAAVEDRTATDFDHLESVLLAIASSVPAHREVVVEIMPAAISGPTQGHGLPFDAFNDLFGPNSPNPLLPRVLAISVRNTGARPVSVEAVTLHWESAPGASSSAVSAMWTVPSGFDMNTPYPVRLEDGEAQRWRRAPITLATHASLMDTSKVAGLFATAVLASGEKFESEHANWADAVATGFGPGSPAI